MSRLGLVLVLVALACVREPTVEVEPPRAPRNLLLVTFDTMRPDVLGAYGGDARLAPTIDRFAREATVFENAIAPMGATFPSHASVFTGQYPRQHGVRANHDRLDASFVTLAEDLRAEGYATAAFVAFGSMLSRGGLDQGFAVRSDDATGVSTGGIRAGDEVTERAVRWLERPRKKPFFLWLHYFEAHAPYRLTPYAQEELAEYAGPLAEGADVKTFYGLGKKIPWTDAERRAVRVLYDGEVRELDRLIAPVLATLDESGAAEDTLVVLTADHGQSLGEGDRVGHGRSLEEAVLRVPLIIRHPYASAFPHRVADRVGIVDLRPTVLELLGQDVDESLDGRSLAPLWRGETLSDRLYFAEMNEPLWDDDPKKVQRRDVAIYEGDLKVVHHRRGTASFDLAADPRAMKPLAREDLPPRAAELEALAKEYHASSAEHSGRVGKKDVADELRALGYLE